MTYLDAILVAHRERAAADERSLERLVEEAGGRPAARGFAQALAESTGLAVIAEIKRRSPSKGDLAVDLDPVALGLDYEAGGAAALSVLTDGPHFGGSPDDLVAARDAVALPVLRKDFTVSARDVCDARIMGADAVLLIAAALDDHELADFHALAVEVGLDALVEIHDEGELARAVDVGAGLIGVNQRDLMTFEVDHERAVRVGQSMPLGTLRVAESGVRSIADAQSLREAGFDAVLVGETLVKASDPRKLVSDLTHAGN